ncbi:MAG: hypothetical protein KC731_30135 [Myxococcales bacterium]|nr:hypothetical protein [Myxococcales bacterium]
MPEQPSLTAQALKARIVVRNEHHDVVAERQPATFAAHHVHADAVAEHIGHGVSHLADRPLEVDWGPVASLRRLTHQGVLSSGRRRGEVGAPPSSRSSGASADGTAVPWGDGRPRGPLSLVATSIPNTLPLSLRLDAAIRRGADVLLASQADHGGWDATIDMGPGQRPRDELPRQ